MTRFSQEQWAALSRLLDEALDIPESDRAAWLAGRRADHPELAPELESLLGRERNIEADGFLSDERAAELPRPFTLAGQTFGAYVLERPLGEGGMGSVWLARRNDGLFEGAAAIKFLSLAVAGPAGEARFRREGSVLARLTHPNIARLLDAGVSATGLPYLVLEYIAGLPIDEWCDARRLSVDARLRLFQQVLDAVAHAHANFIVHRDLKPANILVTNDGTVKLLDFGIAKLLEEGGAASSTLTGAHESLFTYRYAAPEQIRGEHITTATDVYALGVILYELLAGRHPTSEECTTPASHIVAVLNAEPGQLSRAVTASGSHTADEAARLAEARDASPERLHRVLAGDLDNIVSKALKKDPAERYATVSAFAADIQHHLDHEPVSARADSFRYRAGKFVRRHRVAVSVAALLLAALIGGVVRERQLRDRAQMEARKAVAVEQYLVSIFGAVDPFARTGEKPNETSARALLDRGADRIDTAFASQPDVRAELQGALGRVYANLGVYDRATVQLRSSLAARRALYGDHNPEVAEAMDQLGEVLLREDSLAEADTLLRGALALRRKTFGDKSDETAQSLDHLAALLENRDGFAASEPLFREALAIRRELHGDSDLTVATSRDLLGRMLHDKGAHAEAAAEYRKALAIRERRLGRNHPATGELLRDLATAEENLGQYADAERDYRAALSIERATLGSQHGSVSLTLNDLGQMLFKTGRTAEADSMLREALAINRKLFGENHDAVSANLGNLALIVRERGQFDEAERLLWQAYAIDTTLYGGSHVNIGFDLNEIAVVMRLRGRPDSAIPLLRRALAISRRVVGDDKQDTRAISSNLARALIEDGRLAEAEPLMRKALAGLDSTNPDAVLVIIPGRIGLGRILTSTNRAKEALPMLERTVAMSRERSGPVHWRTGETELVLGECQLALGDIDGAEATLREAVQVLQKTSVSRPLLLTEANGVLAKIAKKRRA